MHISNSCTHPFLFISNSFFFHFLLQKNVKNSKKKYQNLTIFCIFLFSVFDKMASTSEHLLRLFGQIHRGETFFPFIQQNHMIRMRTKKLSNGLTVILTQILSIIVIILAVFINRSVIQFVIQ